MQNEKLYKFFNTVLSIPFQLIFVMCTLSLIAYMAHQANIRPNALETIAQLLPVTPKKIIEWGGASTPIKVGLHIFNWVEFDISKNSFVFDGIVWFEFDSRLVSIDSVEKFSFDKAEIIEKKKSDTKITNGLLHVEYEIRVHFNTNLTHQLFPFDDHTLFITLTNRSLSPQETIFEGYQSGFTLSENATLLEWKIIERNVQSGYAESLLDEENIKSTIKNPKIVFSVVVRRPSTRPIFVLFLPMFLLFFTGLFSFGFKSSQEPIITGLGAGSLASLVGYLYVIQAMSPVVGYYLLSDLFFSLILSLTVAIVIVNLISMQLQKDSAHFIILRGFLFFAFHLSLLSAWYYLLFLWTA